MTVPRRAKVLTDFDGVWTSLGRQAEAVDEARERGLAESSGWDREAVRACLDEVRAAIVASPLEHGWRSDGRITAYADEDPFLMHNAMVSGLGLLADAGHPTCQALSRDLAARGHTDLGVLGSALFHEGSLRYLEGKGHDMLPDAISALADLLEVADVVFCTNFAADAVAQTWARHGVDVLGGTPGLTIRGSARKQDLTGDPLREATHAGRVVGTDRGFYRRALLEERPDIVVGDVFSLDLALPLVLGRPDGDLPGVRSLLLRTPFTPNWALDACEQAGSPRPRVIDSPSRIRSFVSGSPGEVTP